MVSKYNKRKLEIYWNNRCAVCGRNDFLEVHHLIPVSQGGSDDYDNLILLCARCHAAVHNRAYKPENYHQNTSIPYEEAVPILEEYFANRIGTKETKERLNLSPKTHHLSESSVVKRYKREHNMMLGSKLMPACHELAKKEARAYPVACCGVFDLALTKQPAPLVTQ